MVRSSMHQPYEYLILFSFTLFQVDISLSLGLPYQTFHHHLVEMLENSIPRSEKRVFNGLSSTSAVLTFLTEKYGV